MKSDWTMYIYKVDRRCKEGRRLVSTTVWRDRDHASMQREITELHLHDYPRPEYVIEYVSTYTTVKNLMTGQDVQIPTEDRGTVCDPSQERYWTM